MANSSLYSSYTFGSLLSENWLNYYGVNNKLLMLSLIQFYQLQTPQSLQFCSSRISVWSFWYLQLSRGMRLYYSSQLMQVRIEGSMLRIPSIITKTAIESASSPYFNRFNMFFLTPEIVSLSIFLSSEYIQMQIASLNLLSLSYFGFKQEIILSKVYTF